MVSRLYKMRLVDRVYPNHDKIEDYIGLLKNKHDQRKHHDPHAAERMTAEDLKKAIGNNNMTLFLRKMYPLDISCF